MTNLELAINELKRCQKLLDKFWKLEAELERYHHERKEGDDFDAAAMSYFERNIVEGCARLITDYMCGWDENGDPRDQE